MVKWVLKVVAALMLSGVIKIRWDVNNAKDIIDMVNAMARDGIITNEELGILLDKIADQL